MLIFIEIINTRILLLYISNQNKLLFTIHEKSDDAPSQSFSSLPLSQSGLPSHIISLPMHLPLPQSKSSGEYSGVSQHPVIFFEKSRI